MAKHHYPPIFFEAWGDSHYVKHKQALMDFLCGLGYEIIQIGKMDYIAQHSSNNRYLKLMTQNDQSITYQMNYKNHQT